MITFNSDSKLFQLTTETTSYWFRVTKFGHLEHVYYGTRLPDDQPIDSLLVKRTAEYGSSVFYNKQEDPLYCLDLVPLEWSGNGCGDYREAPCEIKMPDGSFSTDFIYCEHQLHDGAVEMATLPTAYAEPGACSALQITLRDKNANVLLDLFYTVFDKTDVITRRAVLKNCEKKPLTIRRILSMSVDMLNRDFDLITFDGSWSKEAHRHDRRLQYGTYVNGSTTGASSNRHNPGFLLAENGAGENSGCVYGFNLVYSGNHYSFCERDHQDMVRVGIGIHPHCFEWPLSEDESFETPEAVLSFSSDGFNGLSAHFHDFINHHVVRGDWKGKERPVLLNEWEAYFFKYTRGKLVRLAQRAKKIGAELFVLDDGWFGRRDSDKAGLGDYMVNRKKLPRGLREFANKIHSMGLQFGLWFEPEMVNADSDLYRAHPEYAIAIPGKTPQEGRNQLVLDLCNPAVRDYIVGQVGDVLDGAGVDYVKWDMNRHISDVWSPFLPSQGMYYHSYIIGLYDILRRVFEPRPHILFESCSSGGNRFDLGMLCFSPQIWTSDDTDAVERLKIQEGISYLYPLSTMGAHISEAPHQQTLRETPLSTRFNVACFGDIGYELDLRYLTPVQMREVREQIEFYKAHRRTFQFGRFVRGGQHKDNKLQWQVTAEDGSEAIAGLFQTQATAAEGLDRLCFSGLDEQAFYSVKSKPQRLFINRFGGLVKHLLPITLHPQGFILRTLNKHYALQDCAERYDGYGTALMDGIRLPNQFLGSYYNENTRLLGDFGSTLYVATKERSN